MVVVGKAIQFKNLNLDYPITYCLHAHMGKYQKIIKLHSGRKYIFEIMHGIYLSTCHITHAISASSL
jgi:hypothetical protein